MKLVIPTKIQVGGHVFAVVFNEALMKIELNPARPQSQMIESLLHEVLHAVNEVYAGGKLGEEEVHAISQGLLQVFKQLGIEVDFTEIPEEGT